MVKVKGIRDFLAESSFFDGMNEKHLEMISRCGDLVHFNDGDFLLKEGDEARSFFLIRKGGVAIESHSPSGGALTIAKVGTDGIVGFSWLFPPYRNAFDARAITHVDAVRLNGVCLRGKAEEDHELGYQFMKRFAAIMIQRMQAARLQMLDIYGGSGKAA